MDKKELPDSRWIAMLEWRSYALGWVIFLFQKIRKVKRRALKNENRNKPLNIIMLDVTVIKGIKTSDLFRRD